MLPGTTFSGPAIARGDRAPDGRDRLRPPSTPAHGTTARRPVPGPGGPRDGRRLATIVAGALELALLVGLAAGAATRGEWTAAAGITLTLIGAGALGWVLFPERRAAPQGRSAAPEASAALAAGFDLATAGVAVRAAAAAEEAELRKLLDSARVRERRAVEAVRLKSAVMATVTHELRSPLSGMLGMVEMLRDSRLDERQRHLVDTVHGAGRTLLGLVNDLVDLQRLEGGRLTLETVDFDLHDLIADATEIASGDVRAKPVEVAHVIDAAVPRSVRGDGLRLRQILGNLVANAVKFTEVGEVVVRVTTAPGDAAAPPGRVVVRVTVSDTGIGIASGDEQRLFEAYAQGGGSASQRAKGAGLGLAIARQLTRLMGGSIGARRSPGGGAEFWFELPLQRIEAQTVTRPDLLLTLVGRRVLVVDDNPAVRDAIDHVVRGWGLKATQASSAREAFAVLRGAAARGEPFDVVLVDVVMPAAGGGSLARAINADAEVAGVPVVLLAATLLDLPPELEAAAAAVLRKPVRRAALREALARVLGAHRGQDAGAAAAAAPRFAARVLVVDDDEVNRQVTCARLAELGCSAETARGGWEALERSELAEYDLVLMDCELPDISGLEAAARMVRPERSVAVRTDGVRHQRRIAPVVAVTAHAEDEVRSRCLAAGMSECLVKPLSRADLARALRRWLPAGGADPAASGAHAPAPAAVEAAPEGVGRGGTDSGASAVEADPGGLDPAVLADLRELERAGAAGVVERVIDSYLGDAAATLSAINRAAAAGDATAVAAAAHRLRSSSASIGARRVASLCRELERGASRPEADRIVRLAAAIAAEHESLQPALVAARAGDGGQHG